MRVTILNASAPYGTEKPHEHRSQCGACGAVDSTHFMRIAVESGQVVATLCLGCAAAVKRAAEAQAAPSTQEPNACPTL